MDTITPSPEASAATVAAPVSAQKKERGAWSGLIGILLIVTAIIVGAFYAWGERLASRDATQTEQPTP